MLCIMAERWVCKREVLDVYFMNGYLLVQYLQGCCNFLNKPKYQAYQDLHRPQVA
jgi:hypothetical protein